MASLSPHNFDFGLCFCVDTVVCLCDCVFVLKTIAIDEVTWKVAKQAAVEEGISLSAWVGRAVAREVKRGVDNGGRDVIYQDHDGESGTDPGRRGAPSGDGESADMGRAEQGRPSGRARAPQHPRLAVRQSRRDIERERPSGGSGAPGTHSADPDAITRCARQGCGHTPALHRDRTGRCEICLAACHAFVEEG